MEHEQLHNHRRGRQSAAGLSVASPTRDSPSVSHDETLGDLRAADLADHVRITTHHELIASAGEPDLQALSRSLSHSSVVDREHHGRALQPLESEVKNKARLGARVAAAYAAR